MSVLSPEVHSALAQLLHGLAAADNNIRSHAEDQLSNEWVAARPEMLLMGLVEQIQGPGDLSVGPYDITQHIISNRKLKKPVWRRYRGDHLQRYCSDE